MGKVVSFLSEAPSSQITLAYVKLTTPSQALIPIGSQEAMLPKAHPVDPRKTLGFVALTQR